MFSPLDTSRSSTTSVASLEGGGLRGRLRRYAAAWLLGAAVVLWPAWPGPAQERSARRPAFERALSWRDFIRLRLSPWLLLHGPQDADIRPPDISFPDAAFPDTAFPDDGPFERDHPPAF